MTDRTVPTLPPDVFESVVNALAADLGLPRTMEPLRFRP